jgi:hypothetical protein
MDVRIPHRTIAGNNFPKAGNRGIREGKVKPDGPERPEDVKAAAERDFLGRDWQKEASPKFRPLHGPTSPETCPK